MNKPRKLLIAAAFALCMPVVFACGESMFQSKQGIRYRGFTTHRPADILFYDPESAAGESTRDIYSGLQRAGHHLTMAVAEPAAVDALNSRHFDLIIASPSDLEALTAHLNPSTRAPTLLAVIDDSATPDAAHFPQYVHHSDGVDKYLKTIERMRERGT